MRQPPKKPQYFFLNISDMSTDTKCCKSKKILNKPSIRNYVRIQNTHILISYYENKGTEKIKIKQPHIEAV